MYQNISWLSRELMTELQCKRKKKKKRKRWEQGQATKEEYRKTAQPCWDGLRKGKAELDVKL